MKLRIEKPIYGGASLARVPADDPTGLAGKAVFVPFALPRELVEARIAADHRSYASATLEQVLEPAPGRVLPGCEYYARCGGCHYQHADYPTQLAMKRDILVEALERAQVAPLPEVRVRSAEPWGYRNRVRLHVTRAPHASLSYREAASHRDLAVDHCPVAAPLLQQAIAACNRLLQTQPAMAKVLAEVEFFTNGDESALLVSLFSSTPAKRVDADLSRVVAEALLRELPSLIGVRTFTLDPKTRRTQLANSWGEPSLRYVVGEHAYQVSAAAFFQVNRFLLPALLQEVTVQQSGNVAWDLYAGVGLFAQALSRQFEQVIAVESSPASAADLAHNLHGPPHKRIVQDTLRFLESPANVAQPDLVVVDPPRAGLAADVCERLAAVGTRRIVYVSCDPSTLARDLRTLQPSGYRPVSLILLDLFPQTFHLETVATLERT
ncbi:MAG: rRNA (uracil1939-C5)-methyltransferase [Acidobacteriaceae bacterium]|nr:rRNA (uracil1939-C5)-methyltransferase [Acidobacteriaceae bacterium]